MMRNGSIINPKGRGLLFIQQFAERKKESIKESVSHGFGLVASPRGERSPPQVAISPSKQARKKQTEKESQGWVCSNKDKTGSHIH
jgi:hypothetical protein